jgi:hypothetical protein
MNANGCDARRCRRRIEVDRRRFKDKRWVQCPATTGQRTIHFCELGKDHEGLHLRGTVEWGGDYTHPIAAVLHAHSGGG